MGMPSLKNNSALFLDRCGNAMSVNAVINKAHTPFFANREQEAREFQQGVRAGD